MKQATLHNAFFLIVVFSLALFFITPVFAIDADDLKGRYASTLVDFAGTQDYSIECGDADSLNTQDLLPNIEGYLVDPAVCIARYGQSTSNNRAIIFSLDATTERSAVLEHIGLYNDPSVPDSDIITAQDIDLEACDDATELDNHWWHCDGAITTRGGRPAVNVYYRLGVPTTYLVTVGFTPQFEENWWDRLVDFFRELLGFDPAPVLEEPTQSFTRGYFAHATGSGTRDVQAFYHAQNTFADGSATLIFKDFSFDVSKLARDPPRITYALGSENRQALIFETMTVDEWKHLTAALRLTPNGQPPIAGDVCGNGILGFDEGCELSDEGGFLSRSTTCQDLGFSYGTISCGENCELDTSGCVSCEDLDDDGYFNANGEPGALRSVNKDLLIGGLTQKDTSNSGDLIALPLSFFGATTQINQLATSSLSTFNTCLQTRTEFECYQEPSVFTIAGSLVSKFSAQTEGTTCTWGNCTLTAHSFGAITTYNEALQNNNQHSQRPFFVIDLEELSTSDFGSAPSAQNYENRLRVAIACKTLGQAVQNSAQTIAPELRVDSFIYLSRNIDQEQYDVGYQACRAGLAAVNAKLYYTAPINTLANKDVGIVDGIVTTNPEKYVYDVVIPNSDPQITYRDFRRVQSAKLVVIQDILGAYRTSAQAVFTQNTTLARNIQETLDQTYIARDGTQTNAQSIITHAQTSEGSDFVYIKADTPGLGLPFDVTTCEGNLFAAQNEEFVESNEAIADLPAGFFRYDVDDWSCFLEDTNLGVCSDVAQAFDCNDTASDIHPGAPEICGDLIDNDCDGLIDSQDSCDDYNQTTGQGCNFDNFCDATTENIYTCTDCTQNTCPSEEVLMHTQGAYRFYAKINAQGIPSIIAEYDGVTTEGAGENWACDWDADNREWEGPARKEFAINFNTNQQHEIYSNPPGHTAKVFIVQTGSSFRLKYEDGGSGTSRRCWDYNGGNGFFGPTMNLFEYASCTYRQCQVNADCESGVCRSFAEGQIQFCSTTTGGGGILPTCTPECEYNEVCTEFGTCAHLHP